MSNNVIAKTETVLQIEATECGAACLAMVLNYFGQNVSLDQMRIEADVSRDGCNAGNICRAAEARGLRSAGYRRDADDLDDMVTPCIIWWERNHFVVYEGCKGSKYYINDPAFGKRKLSKEEFCKGYSGIILEFERGEDFKETTEIKQGHSAGTWTGQMVAAGAASVLSGLCGVIAALLIGEITNGRGIFAIAFGASVIAMLLLAWWSSCQRAKCEKTIELSSTHLFLQKLFSMPSSFFEQRHPSDMVARVQKNSRLVRFTASDLVTGVSDFAVALICLIALTMVSCKAGAVALISALVGVAIGVGTYTYRRQLDTQISMEKALVARSVYTGLCRTDSIINAGCGDTYSEKMLESHRNLSASERRMRRTLSMSGCTRTIVYLAGLVVILILADIGSASVLHIVSLIMLYVMLVLRAEKIQGYTKPFADAERDRRIVEDTETYSDASQIQKADSVYDFKKLHGNIKFRDVSFSYLKYGQPVIDNINIDIPSGSIVGITGGTGSGKSTLAKLFSGMRKPTKGEITYDGRALNSIPRKIFTASVATVPQKPVLLTGSVRDNITLWNNNVSDEAIDKAAEDACIRDAIMQREGGYAYEIGERGTGFSGGEQQRIEIARALATDPSVIILDEGTSGLDDECAEKVISNIRKRGCTAIFITQKKFILDMCNMVIDLGNEEDAAV